MQVETHRPDRFPPDWWWPLVFVAPGTEPFRVSVFVVEGPDRSHLLHLPREGESTDFLPLAAWFDTLLGCEDEAPPAGREPAGDVLPLAPSETWIVLRYFLREQESLPRVDARHFTSGFALLEALLSLARGGGVEDVPIDQRPPRLSPSAPSC